MVFPRAAVGNIVGVYLHLTFGVGDLGQVAVGVVGVSDGLAQRTDLHDHAVEPVVGETVGVAFRILHADEVAAGVVTVLGGAVGGIGGLVHSSQGIVTGAAVAISRIDDDGEVAYSIVLVFAALAAGTIEGDGAACRRIGALRDAVALVVLQVLAQGRVDDFDQQAVEAGGHIAVHELGDVVVAVGLFGQVAVDVVVLFLGVVRRIGQCDRVACSVVAIAGFGVVGVGDGEQLAGRVVAQGAGVVGGIGEADGQAGFVIGDTGGAVQRVGDA